MNNKKATKKDRRQVYLVTEEEMLELAKAYVNYLQFKDYKDIQIASYQIDKAWKVCKSCPLPKKELGL